MGQITETMSFTGQVVFGVAPTFPVGSFNRSDIVTDSLQPYPIPLLAGKVHDAIQTNLPVPNAANDDLGVMMGTWGTNPFYLSSGDAKATTTKTYYGVWEVMLPVEFVSAGTVAIRITAGMQTTVAGTSATIDLTAYESTGASTTGISADLCATAAQSMNSLTTADYDFTITATSLVAGDTLIIRPAMNIVDAATGTAVIGNIYAMKLLCDVKG